METKRGKYDTNPLDPDFVKNADKDRGDGGKGPALSCRWLDDHPDQIAAWKVREAQPVADEPARPSMDPALAHAEVLPPSTPNAAERSAPTRARPRT